MGMGWLMAVRNQVVLSPLEYWGLGFRRSREAKAQYDARLSQGWLRKGLGVANLIGGGLCFLFGGLMLAVAVHG